MAGFWDTGGGEVFGDSIVSIWDRFVVAGRALPGVATVEGSKSCKLDQRNAPGTDGATLTHMGNESSPVTVRLRIWTADQYEAWKSRREELMASTGKARPKPVMVYHPALADLGIKSLYVKEVGFLRTQPGGLGEVIIKFLEFLPPSKAGVSTPKAAINTSVPNAFGSGAPPAGKPPSAKVPGP
jgi:hypothetical protein